MGYRSRRSLLVCGLRFFCVLHTRGNSTYAFCNTSPEASITKSRQQSKSPRHAIVRVPETLLRWNPTDEIEIDIDDTYDADNDDTDANVGSVAPEEACRCSTIIQPQVFSTLDNKNCQSTASDTIALSLLLFFVTLPLASWAIDHPGVDQPALGIPSFPVPDLRYFLSGGLCAATSHGITTPIDVVKTRIQAQPETFGEDGVLDAARRILDRDGPSALLGGLAPTVVGYGVEGAVKFGLYESLKPTFASVLLAVAGNSDKTIPYLGASVCAGAAASLLLCPLERVRIRMVTGQQSSADASRSGLLAGLSSVVREEGAGSLFGGIGAMLSKQVPYTIFKQVSFDVFAGLLYGAAAAANLAEADVKAEVAVLAAFLASILACAASQPGDVILTATYKNTKSTKTVDENNDDAAIAAKQLDGFGVVVSRIYEQKGIAGFFTGITARFFHVGAIITSQLVLYDVIKQLLGLPATGTN